MAKNKEQKLTSMFSNNYKPKDKDVSLTGGMVVELKRQVDLLEKRVKLLEDQLKKVIK